MKYLIKPIRCSKCGHVMRQEDVGTPQDPGYAYICVYQGCINFGGGDV